MSGQDGHIEQVAQALDAALVRVEDGEKSEGGEKVYQLSTDKFVIFSDMHKGARNRADDFRWSERAYNAALAYYFNMGYTLVVLGDAEELWEERPKSVFGAYPHTFELEAQFHREGRYFRVWGNHDDEWQYKNSVNYFFGTFFKEKPLKIHESLRFTVVDDEGKELGKLFLIHGHQGDEKSDRWKKLSKPLVRIGWRPFQRLTNISLNTPAKSWDLREKYNKAMYSWAKNQENLVLIAGHTHRPVFGSQSHEKRIKKEINKLTKNVKGDLDPAQRKEKSLLLAEVEWIRAQQNEAPGKEAPVPMDKPCYFNTGCCSYSDGDITGIEIADGEIRLVRWPDEQSKPKPHVLESDSLVRVFSEL